MKEENEKKNKKKLIKKIIYISIIIILSITSIFIFQKIYSKLLQKRELENSTISFSEKNSKTIFSINKIVFFSSSDSKSKSSSLTNFTIENLYTYTDIAIFINNNSDENSIENTLKKVKIDNIKLTKEPVVGQSNFYYKSINNFAKSEFSESNIIEKGIEFEITSEDNADLSRPILYNNCANPITLSYVNQNIKKDYTITDTKSPIIYNGNLLEKCGVSISSIEAVVSFDIDIENNKNQKFKTTVYFNIPYQDEEKSIYDGSLVIKKDTDFNFYRYE